MSVRIDLAVPGDLRFGAGRIAEVPAALAALGVTRALVVTGRTTARADGVRESLRDNGIVSDVYAVHGEPHVDTVRAGVMAARGSGCDGVLGLGGGSALDVAKAVAVLAPSGADPLDHLEVVGRGLPFTAPGLPFVAVPTTAGTGSEVTRNAVLTADGPDGPVKVSLRSPFMTARLAVVDPGLLAGLPRATVAAAGADALTQLVEAFLSSRASPITDALARDGLRRSARSLPAAVELGLDGDVAAPLRDDLALASTLGGICLANAGLGVVHGFAGVVGGRYDAPHGAVCAALLAPGVSANLSALVARSPDHPSVAKAAELGALLTGRPDAGAGDVVPWLDELRAALGLPGLAAYGVVPDDVPSLVAGARRASSTKANPVELTEAELTEVLMRSL